MAGRERLSRQELIRRQRRDGFVGRRDELATFSENLGQTPERAEFLFHVRGQAGVGKSTLVGQMAGIAREQRAATARVDESAASVVEAMETVAAQLGQQGLTFKGFEKQLAAYRQRRHEAEAGAAAVGAAGPVLEGHGLQGPGLQGSGLPSPGLDGPAGGHMRAAVHTAPAGPGTPGGPGGPSAGPGTPVGRTAPLSPSAAPAPSPAPSPSSVIASQVGLAGLGMVPGLGAFAGAVDPNQLAMGADRLRAMLSTRFRSQDDVQLVLSPLRVLTPVFLDDLHEAAQRTTWVTLFFDTYERTGPILDVWLRDILFSERYGSLPANVLVVLAGQNRLDARCWGDWQEFVNDLPLEVFTEAEARQLLSDKGVTEERITQVVLQLSGRLPVLLSTLAESRPSSAEEVGDPSGTAVERFLKWESDPARRAAALACALPQELNEDVYRATVNEEAAGSFGWLCTLPFVDECGGRCHYHDVVRTAMLRLQRTKSPRTWHDQHSRLAETFGAWRRRLQDGDPDRPEKEWWEDQQWREHRFQETYHRLCADERTALPGALRELLDAYDHGIGTLRRWARMLSQAGDDCTSAALTEWGRTLAATLDGEDDPGVAVVTLLLAKGELADADRAFALSLRGGDLRVAEEHERALADFDAALALDPDGVRALYGRGRTYLVMGRDDEALADFQHVLRLDPDHHWAVRARGMTFALMERNEEALADYDRTLAVDPDDDWTLACRATTYRLMERYEEALADYDRALEIDPEYTWALSGRGLTYRLMRRFQEALSDFDRAIGVNPEYDWAVAQRGETYRLTERHTEALADFDRALEIDPDDAWTIASRAQTLTAVGRHEEALADYDRALGLNPGMSWAVAHRGETYRLMGRNEEALADFDHALELAPDRSWSIASRGTTYRAMDRYEEALADLDHALRLRPDMDWALSERGEIFRLMGRFEEALADFDRALSSDPDSAADIADRALTYEAMGRHDEAAAGFGRAVELWTDQTAGPQRDALRARSNIFTVHCATRDWERAASSFEAFMDGDPDRGLRRDTLMDLDMVARVIPSIAESVLPYRRRLEETETP